MAVFENQNEKNLKQTLWLLTIYLILTDIFGFQLLYRESIFAKNPLISSDNYVNQIPLKFSAKSIELIPVLVVF